MVPTEKKSFIKTELFLLLNSITADSKPLWGKMNAQQMLEHLVAFFNVSTEKIKFELVTPPEHLPKYKEFLLSDKPFRENTKAPLTVLGDEPLPIRYSGMEEAKASLTKAVNDFEIYFINEPGKKTLHPVFGPLDFEEWILLHYKHVTHHLRQFGISC
jgi:oxepin-CoA hydrolase/3-oxo-5,6-dehydrosuberyl-CoA semialdehyde dehydrogenase